MTKRDQLHQAERDALKAAAGYDAARDSELSGRDTDAWTVFMSALSAVHAARDALRDSDEAREYTLYDRDGTRQTTVTCRPAAMEELARRWLRSQHCLLSNVSTAWCEHAPGTSATVAWQSEDGSQGSFQVLVDQ